MAAINEATFLFSAKPFPVVFLEEANKSQRETNE
jgi:hypothetical protein